MSMPSLISVELPQTGLTFLVVGWIVHVYVHVYYNKLFATLHVIVAIRVRR